MPRNNNFARNSFFKASMAKADALHKKRVEMRNLKSGEIMPDLPVSEGNTQPKVIGEEVVPDLEVDET
jgi:hypothetical protein